MSERVVISGVGMVTPLGIGKKAFSRRLFRGDSGISPITAFDTSRFLSKLGAEVHGFKRANSSADIGPRKSHKIGPHGATANRYFGRERGFFMPHIP